MSMDEDKRGPGRPKGSRNKPVLLRDDRLIPPGVTGTKADTWDDFRHADIDTMVSRQLSLLDWAQQAVRNELMRGYQARGVSVAIGDLEKLERLSNGIVRAIDALKKCSLIAEELASKMTPEQLLEAALKKLEGQDLATLQYAIKRLRAHRERIAPVTHNDKVRMLEVARTPPNISASAAIASLGDDE